MTNSKRKTKKCTRRVKTEICGVFYTDKLKGKAPCKCGLPGCPCNDLLRSRGRPKAIKKEKPVVESVLKLCKCGICNRPVERKGTYHPLCSILNSVQLRRLTNAVNAHGDIDCFSTEQDCLHYLKMSQLGYNPLIAGRITLPETYKALRSIPKAHRLDPSTKEWEFRDIAVQLVIPVDFNLSHLIQPKSKGGKPSVLTIAPLPAQYNKSFGDRYGFGVSRYIERTNYTPSAVYQHYLTKFQGRDFLGDVRRETVRPPEEIAILTRYFGGEDPTRMNPATLRARLRELHPEHEVSPFLFKEMAFLTGRLIPLEDHQEFLELIHQQGNSTNAQSWLAQYRKAEGYFERYNRTTQSVEPVPHDQLPNVWDMHAITPIPTWKTLEQHRITDWFTERAVALNAPTYVPSFSLDPDSPDFFNPFD